MKETKRDIVRRLRKEGLTVQEIVRKTGMNPSTARTYYREWRRLEPGKGLREPMGPGMNADRHLCRTCQYRARKDVVNGCDYYINTEKLRRCKWADCDKYVKGPRLRVKRGGEQHKKLIRQDEERTYFENENPGCDWSTRLV